MAHTGAPDGEQIVPGFTDVAAARAYAEARIRASVEELRKPGQTAAELRSLWLLYGEDCSVIGDSFKGRDMLDLYLEIAATPAECDWPALAPELKRFYTTVLISEKGCDSVWAGGFLRRYTRPKPADLLLLYAEDARAAFARKGMPDAEPVSINIANLFELPEPPHPPADDKRTLRHWRVEVDFVCHDVKFGGSGSGTFGWPDEPFGGALDQMLRVLMAETMSMRGDGPDYVDYCDVLAARVTETPDAVDDPGN